MGSLVSVWDEDPATGSTDEGSMVSPARVESITRRAGRASRVRRMKARVTREATRRARGIRTPEPGERTRVADRARTPNRKLRPG